MQLDFVSLLSLEPQVRLVADGEVTLLVVKKVPQGMAFERYGLGTQPTLDAVLDRVVSLGHGPDTNERIAGLERQADTHRAVIDQLQAELSQSHAMIATLQHDLQDARARAGAPLLASPDLLPLHTAVDTLTCDCGFVAKTPPALNVHITTRNNKASRRNQYAQMVEHRRTNANEPPSPVVDVVTASGGRFTLTPPVDTGPADPEPDEPISTLPRATVPVYDAAAHVPEVYKPYSPHIHLTATDRARAQHTPAHD